MSGGPTNVASGLLVGERMNTDRAGNEYRRGGFNGKLNIAGGTLIARQRNTSACPDHGLTKFRQTKSPTSYIGEPCDLIVNIRPYLRI